MGCIQGSMKVKRKDTRYMGDAVIVVKKGKKIRNEKNSDADLGSIAIKFHKPLEKTESNFPEYCEDVHTESSDSLDKFDTVSLPDVTEHPTYQTVLVKGRKSCKHRAGVMSHDSTNPLGAHKGSKTSFEAETSILDCKICHKNHTLHLVQNAAGKVNNDPLAMTSPMNKTSSIKCNVNWRNHHSSNLAQLIAVNALYLAAPASEAILNNRKNEWVQLAGHPGSFAPASSHTIWKKRMCKLRNEVNAYRTLMEESARDIVPKFYREVEHQGEYFMELQDLLQSFHDPNIIDIKMGIRTFLEPEVMNPVLRHDLYKKMIAIDPNAPTLEEHSQKSVTKLRYMQFREQMSSTAVLGFRIEAVRMSGQKPLMNWKSTRSRAQIAAVLSRFFNHEKKLLSAVAKRLKDIRTKFELSHFFRTHEIIGSSLLLLYDSSGKSGAWMIDFAKTLSLDDGVKITHKTPWVCGNHEDGYLLGLNNLIAIFDHPAPQDRSCLDCFVNDAAGDS